MKRWVGSVTGLLLLLAGGASARELRTVDAFAESVAATSPTPSRRPTRLPGARVLSTEPRLGVPTMVWATPSGVDPRILSGLRRMGPEQAARVHLARLAPLYGLTPEVAASVPATVGAASSGPGAVLVTFRQEVEGVELFRESLKVLMNERHELVALSGYLSPHLGPGARADKLRFVLEARQAIAAAYADLHGERLDVAALAQVGSAQGPYTSYALTPAASARSSVRMVTPARARRVFFSLPDTLVPAWYVELNTGTEGHPEADYYAYVIAADDGRLLFRNNLTVSDAFSYRVWADAAAPYLPHDGPQGLTGSPHPTGTPDGYQAPFTAPSLVSLSHAPFSRGDPWLAPSATETVGNNADAYVDISGSDGLDGTDFRASLSGAAAFDRVYDVTLEPGASADQRMAAVTQLFYITNFLHDWYYDSGFDEAAGNAQQDNFGRGGLGNDSLRVEAQDSSGLNSSNMATPADGARPRMQMLLFTPNVRHSFTVLSPPDIAGQYVTRTATFGPRSFEVEAPVVLSRDGTGSPTDGCQTLIDDMTGKLVLIDRGTCNVNIKVRNAQTAGAVGALIAHNAPGAPPELTGTDASITIPALSLSQADGTLLKGQLPNGPVVARMYREPGVYRDSAVDSTLVAHEWGHYLSNRLVGNANGLPNSQGRALGEGWSDFHALLMMVRAEDEKLPGNADFTGTYAVGGYVASGGGNDGYYFGLRRYPYSTDFTRNALTFKHIQNGVALPSGVPVNPRLPSNASNAQALNSGEVWATMLWECYTALLRDGARLSFEEAQRRMKRYLVLAYQLTPPVPTFLEARDALLAAALAESPEDFRLFHAAFARRGAGLRAVAPPRESTNHAGLVESFASGKDVEFEGAELVDLPGSCDSDGVLDHGEAGVLRVSIANTGLDTVSATTAQVSSTDPGVTLGNGGRLTFPPIAPFDSATVELPVSVEGPASIRSVSFTLTYGDAEQALPGRRTAVFSARVNTDESPDSSTVDDVESREVKWIPARDTSLAEAPPWRRYEQSPIEHFFSGANAPFKADIFLVSPPLQVATGQPFGFTFLHRYQLEADAFDLLDGGVIELSVDNGATWTDIGASATPGYTGTIYSAGTNPLAGRDAYGGTSEGYPQWVPVSVDLGTAYAGQTVRIRFRIGTDVNIGATGWDIDALSFSGLSHTPFNALVVESAPCANTPPTAQAGPDQTVDERGEVTLDGSGSSDPDAGATLAYTWTQVAGPTVTLSGAHAAQPTFTAPEVTQDTVLTFQLTVGDGRALANDTVSVTVRQVNRAPVAGAGDDQTVSEGSPVVLSGRGVDPDGDALTSSWKQTAGPAVTLTDAGPASVGFVAPEVSDTTVLTFVLTVEDTLGLRGEDAVSVTVTALPEPDGGVGSDGGLGSDAGSGAEDGGGDRDAGSGADDGGLSEGDGGPSGEDGGTGGEDGGPSGEDAGLGQDGGTPAGDGGPGGDDGGTGDGDGEGSDSGGCGCATGNSTAVSLMPLLLLALALRSRRRLPRQ